MHALKGLDVVAAFDGGAITSDAGGLLLGATDRAIRLIDRFAACFRDMRCPELIEHEGARLAELRQIFAEAVGGHREVPSRAGMRVVVL